jgi:hypothetical protein
MMILGQYAARSEGLGEKEAPCNDHFLQKLLTTDRISGAKELDSTLQSHLAVFQLHKWAMYCGQDAGRH